MNQFINFLVNSNPMIKAAQGNPQALYDEMLRTNPRFADFVAANKGKTPEEIAKEHNIDPSILNLFK